MQITNAHAVMLFYSTQVVLGFFNLGRSTRVVQFYRSDDGKVMNDGAQSDDSQLSDEQALITMKFPGEVRMSLGCAAVQKVGATEPEGVRAEMFDYSDHTVITIKRGRELKKMADAAAMTSGDKKWVKSNRVPGAIYEGDALPRLPQVGQRKKGELSATEKKLVEQGIKVVGDFANLTDEEIHTKAAAMPGISEAKMKAWREAAMAAIGGDPPADTDFRNQATNGGFASPYEALGRDLGYGENWMEFMWKESPHHKGFMCVKKLVRHIMNETQKMFNGTTHEKDFLVYHDALSQMTNKETIAWMKTQFIDQRSYYDIWILPQFGLNNRNDIVDGLARYDGRPVGNSPEFMPWDNALNKDIDDDVLTHVLLTSDIKKDASGKYPPAKFSLETPQLGAEAYRRRIDPKILPLGSPRPSRIVQDVKKALAAFEIVYRHGGAQVPYLANQNGHRRRTLYGNWGGTRVKKAAAVLVEEMEARWANVDAAVVGVMAAGLEAVKNKCRASIENLPEGELEDEDDDVVA